MAFHELRVSLPQLLEYVQEVDAGQIPHSVPHIPVPKSQAHIYTGPGMRIQRKTAKATNVELVSHGADTMEVGSAGEEEEEDAEVDFEEIPGYLPPLPKTKEGAGGL